MKLKITEDILRRTRYISFDPGETTGIALWSETGATLLVTELNKTELTEALNLIEEVPPKEIVIEEYRVFRHVNHTGSKIETVQVIGRIKRVAEKFLIPVIELRASVKSTAAKWAQVKIPKGHMPDYLSAYLLGYYHLHYNKKLIPAKVLEK